MKQFFLYLALVVVVVFATDRLLGFGYDRLYAQVRTGQTGGKITHYLTLPKQPELVIMGNSRAYYQVIPDSFPVPTFNLCHAGMNQAFQNGLLSIITHAGHRPRIILLHIDTPEYFLDEEQASDIQNLRYYAGRDTTVNRYIAAISPYERYKYLFSTYRYNGRVINLVKNFMASRGKSVAQLGDGFERIEATDRDSIQTLYSVASDKKLEIPRAFRTERINNLKWFIARCRTENIRLICFTSPLYEASSSAKEACHFFGKELHQLGIPYIDYVNHPIAELYQRPKLWKDSNHLNILGAQFESHDLARRVSGLLAAPPVVSPPPVAHD